MKRVFVDSIIVWMIMFAWAAGAQRPSASKPEQERSCSLPRALWQIANKYDIYFTIENEMTRTTTSTQSMEWHRYSYTGEPVDSCNYLQEGANDLNRELRAIQRDLPDLGYLIDTANPRVVHVFDTHLLAKPSYSLARVVGPLQFKGTEAELVYWLHRQGIGVALGVLFDDKGDPKFNPAAVEAHSVPVDIKMQAATIRELLSTFMPKDKDERILWMSSTDERYPETTYLGFGYRWYKDQVYKR